MGEEAPRGDAASDDRGATAPSGWVTTQVAARSLDIQPRTVRWHIEQGNLEAKPQGEGVRRSWLVSIDSLQAFRDTRQRGRELPRGYRAPTESADIAAESPGNAIRELAERLVEEASKASEFRVRLELSERAESTLREELEEERHRREEAERQREDLREDLRRLLRLQTLRGARESPVSPGPNEPNEPPLPDAPADAQEATERPQAKEMAEPQSSWWRRLWNPS